MIFVLVLLFVCNESMLFANDSICPNYYTNKSIPDEHITELNSNITQSFIKFNDKNKAMRFGHSQLESRRLLDQDPQGTSPEAISTSGIFVL